MSKPKAKAKSAVKPAAKKAPPPAIQKVDKGEATPTPPTPPFTPEQLRIVDAIATESAKRVLGNNLTQVARAMAEVLETGAAQTDVNNANTPRRAGTRRESASRHQKRRGEVMGRNQNHPLQWAVDCPAGRRDCH